MGNINLKRNQIWIVVGAVALFAFLALTFISKSDSDSRNNKSEYSGYYSYNVADDKTSNSERYNETTSDYSKSRNSAISNSVIYDENSKESDYHNASEITIQEGVTIIERETFMGCRMEKITIPSSVTTIREYAFSNCKNLKEITIPSSVTAIVNGAFQYCTSLTSVNIEGSLTYLGAYTFLNCTNLKSVNIFSVERIEGGAFEDCKNLENIVIQGGLKVIGEKAFRNCEKVNYINLGNLTDVRVGNNAFSGLGTLSNKITTGDVSDYMFSGCLDLTSVTILEGATYIGMQGFSNCKNLIKITIPNSVTKIGGRAFWKCKYLKSISIPSSVTEMGGVVFEECNSLTDVYCYATTPPSSTRLYPFKEMPKNVTLHVPKGSKTAYENDEKWKEYFASIIEIDDNGE